MADEGQEEIEDSNDIEAPLVPQDDDDDDDYNEAIIGHGGSHACAGEWPREDGEEVCYNVIWHKYKRQVKYC